MPMALGKMYMNVKVRGMQLKHSNPSIKRDAALTRIAP